MKDQAEKLRELINLKKNANTKLNTLKITKQTKQTKQTKVISVTSGKGGVGKTNFTVNLAISLSNLGYKVIVLDADIGLANIDVLLDVIPQYSITDVINGNKEITEILTEGPNGIMIIAGGSGINELPFVSKEQLDYVIKQLIVLEDYADFILIDTGAGISNTVLSFVNAADEIILVTTPEPTSLTDCYAMVKMLSKLGRKSNLKLVVNKAENSIEAKNAYKKISLVSQKFLKMKIDDLGFLCNNRIVIESVKKQIPFIILYPYSEITSKINSIALKISGATTEEKTNSQGLKEFGIRLLRFFGKGGP